MALIEWSDTYSVKVKQLDDQHRKLIELINKLHDAMKAGKGSQIVGEVLASLADYTRSHFAAEENLMKTYNYPGYEAHKKAHNSLVLQVHDIQQRFQQGNAPLSQNVMTFLRDWLIEHIHGTDKSYGPFFNANGVS